LDRPHRYLPTLGASVPKSVLFTSTAASRSEVCQPSKCCHFAAPRANELLHPAFSWSDLRHSHPQGIFARIDTPCATNPQICSVFDCFPSAPGYCLQRS
jgi:hypothetical protein